jgi:hypothetical protein
MPHESTVNPNEEVRDDTNLIQRTTRTSSVNNSHQPHLNENNYVEHAVQIPAPELTVRPDTPPSITHHDDFDDDDDESDESNKEIIA